MPDANDDDHSASPPPAASLSLGEALRAGRRDLGLSQRALAERAGLSKSVLARLEQGGQAGTLAQIEAALCVLGMGLCVRDRDGSIWQDSHALGVDRDGVRDEGGRRLPAHLYPRAVSSPEPGWRYFRREMRALRQGRQWPAPADGRTTYMYPQTKRFWDSLLGEDPDLSGRR